MNNYELNQLPNLSYNDASKRLAVKIITNEEQLFAIWIETGKLMLEVNFSKKWNQLLQLGGEVGDAIKSSNITDQQKIERVGEALHNALWDYYNKPPLQFGKRM